MASVTIAEDFPMCISNPVLSFWVLGLYISVRLLDISKWGTLRLLNFTKCPKLDYQFPHCPPPTTKCMNERKSSCVQMFSIEWWYCLPSYSSQNCFWYMRDSFILSVTIKSHNCIELIYLWSLKRFVFASVPKGSFSEESLFYKID